MLAVVLDSIHGFISVLDELGNIFAVVGRKRDSDTRANSRLLAITQDDRLRYEADHLCGNPCLISASHYSWLLVQRLSVTRWSD